MSASDELDHLLEDGDRLQADAGSLHARSLVVLDVLNRINAGTARPDDPTLPEALAMLERLHAESAAVEGRVVRHEWTLKRIKDERPG